jgi:predicted Fe-S protein YdhL (DUF1289 family)
LTRTSSTNNLYVTPCISVCQIDENRTCSGCGRTIDQIRDWTKYDHETRMEIMKGLGYGKRRNRLQVQRSKSNR